MHQTIEDKVPVHPYGPRGASVELVCRLLEDLRSGDFTNGWAANPLCAGRRIQELKRRLLSLHQRYPALGLDSLYHLIRPQLSCSRKLIHRPDETG